MYIQWKTELSVMVMTLTYTVTSPCGQLLWASYLYCHIRYHWSKAVACESCRVPTDFGPTVASHFLLGPYFTAWQPANICAIHNKPVSSLYLIWHTDFGILHLLPFIESWFHATYSNYHCNRHSPRIKVYISWFWWLIEYILSG